MTTISESQKLPNDEKLKEIANILVIRLPKHHGLITKEFIKGLKAEYGCGGELCNVT